MKFTASHIPNMEILAQLFGKSEELTLIWPKVLLPFDPEQWREEFASHPDNLSILFQEGGEWIGHTALIRKQSKELWLCFVFLAPDRRGTNLAREMLEITEKIAVEQLQAPRLRLVVRDFNPRAHRLYCKTGYTEFARAGTAIQMEKIFFNP